MEKRSEITIDRILSELASIGLNKEAERTADRLRALELAGKHLGMFNDRVAVEVEDLSALADLLK